MIKKIVVLTLILFISQTGISQISELPIDNAHSVISFSVRFAGGLTKIEGRFNEFSGSVGYDNPDDLSTLYADVTIKVASLNTADDQRNEDLMGDGFFNETSYPEITFKSSAVKRHGEQYIMTGAFTMLGKTVNLEVPFERVHPNPIAWAFGEPRIALSGTVTIDRLEFGIPKRGWDNILPSLGSISLSNEVKINLSIMGRGESLGSEMVAALETGGVKAAIDKYRSLEKVYGKIEHTYSFDARTVASAAMQLTRSGKIEEAVEIGKFAMEIDPKNFMPYYALGGAYQALGDKTNAIKNFEKVLELRPGLPQAQQALTKLKN
jgi:polyisoprenoid-binding protein YceI